MNQILPSTKVSNKLDLGNHIFEPIKILNFTNLSDVSEVNDSFSLTSLSCHQQIF